MRLILVRHGQTVCNTDNIWHGWDDCELTPVGLTQAEAVAERLAGERVDAVYSSPSRRARQTAEAIATRHDLPVHLEPGLRERNAGEFEGIVVDEIVARHPTVWDDRDADYWGWRPPGGETFREVLERTLAVVERLQEAHPDQTVVIATHMGPARVLMSHITGVSLGETYKTEFPSTGVSIFTFDGDRSTAELLNDAGHVEGTGSREG